MPPPRRPVASAQDKNRAGNRYHETKKERPKVVA
jgi:hypothetical protein